MRKVLLLVLPIATVVVVAFALFVVGAPKPYMAARVLGGPTEGIQRIAVRVQLFQREGEYEEPISVDDLTVTATLPSGQSVTVEHGAATGTADVMLPQLPSPLTGPVRISVSSSSHPGMLASGRAELPLAKWQEEHKRHGGWSGASTGALTLKAAARRGAFAVPFEDMLLVSVTRKGKPVPEATLGVQVDGDGGKWNKRSKAGPLGKQDQIAPGIFAFPITPQEHVVTVDVTAKLRESVEEQGADDPDAEEAKLVELTGKLHSMLPVRPGVLLVERTAEGLRVASPIKRDAAFVSVFTPRSRAFGQRLTMADNGRGGSVGTVALPDHLKRAGDLWAVASPELDLTSSSALGWPLAGPDLKWGTNPKRTLTVHEQLWVDGTINAYKRDQTRLSRARLLAALFAGAALGLVVVIMVTGAHGAQRDLEKHLAEAGLSGDESDRVAPGRRGAPLVTTIAAVLCVALGFAVIALVAMYRI